MAKNEPLTAKKIADALESGALVPAPRGTVKSYVREDGVRVVTEFSLDSISLVPPRHRISNGSGEIK